MHQHRLPAFLVAASVALMGATTANANAADLIAKASTAPSSKPAAKPHMRWTWMWCNCGKVAVDGIYGAQTTQAVRAFQRHHGLAVDGIAGPKTLMALGLKGRTLNQGATGDDVKRLQRSLGHHRMWMQVPATGTKPTTKPSTKPSAKPSTAPTPMATPMPTPMPTMRPTVEPTMRPTAAPTVAPTPAPVSEGPQNRPTFELHAADWMLPTNAVGAPYSPGMAWMGGASLWFGEWGIGGDATMFPNFIPAPGSAALGATNMYDADLKWRSTSGWMSASLGWRGVAGTNYGAVGVRWDLPLVGDWLWLNFGGKGAYNFSNAYQLDGLAGLDLKFGPVLIDGGYRYLWTSLGGGTETWQAPYVGVGLGF